MNRSLEEFDCSLHALRQVQDFRGGSVGERARELEQEVEPEDGTEWPPSLDHTNRWEVAA